MDEKILKELYAPFETKKRQGLGGMTFEYIPSNYIIDRMNKVFDGNWNTRVTKTQTIEDSVLLKVQVEVFHDGNWFGHEGFGASSFKRFKEGPNKGKIIDVGNAYKSALSMAIRNACTRFGCGLESESDPEASTSGSEEKSSNASPPAPSMPSAPTTGTSPGGFPPFNIPNSGTQKTTTGEPPFPAPPTNTEPQKLGKAWEELSSFTGSTNGPKIPPRPEEIKNTSPPPDIESTTEETTTNVITDVQRTALDFLLNVKGLDYTKLAQAAFEDAGLSSDGVVPDKDNLTTNQAALIIKFGNDKSNEGKLM